MPYKSTSHFFLIFGKMAEDSEDIFFKRLRPKGLIQREFHLIVKSIPFAV